MRDLNSVVAESQMRISAWSFAVAIALFSLVPPPALQAQESVLASSEAIAHDAAKHVVMMMTRTAKSGDRGPLRVDEAESVKALSTLAGIMGLTSRGASPGRIFPSLENAQGDSRQRCAAMETLEGWCSALTSRQVLSLHGARQISDNEVIVRIKVLQWITASSHAAWFVADVHHTRGVQGLWSFQKMGSISAG